MQVGRLMKYGVLEDCTAHRGYDFSEAPPTYYSSATLLVAKKKRDKIVAPIGGLGCGA